MKLALWQAEPANGQIETVLSSICRQLQAAAAGGARMLVAPELMLPGYNRPDLHESLSQPLDGEWITRLRAMARQAGCGITLGWAERAEGRTWNATTAIGPDGAILGHYRKIQLFGPMETASFARGDRLAPPFMLDGHRVGLLICYDIEFPGHAAALAGMGADLILVPTANPCGYEHVQRRLVPARAHECDCVIAYANLTGQEQGLAFGGLSLIAGPDGEALAQAGPRGEALLIVDLAAAASVPDMVRSAQRSQYRPA